MSDIELTDISNFVLDLSGGSNPCNSTSSTLAAGSNCTVEVIFDPQSMASFNEYITISSTDPDTPIVNVSLSGIQEEISELNVRINQLETSCSPPSIVHTAYVSVIDQGGYPVTTLLLPDFLITEDSNVLGNPKNSGFITNAATLSVAVVMDYSSSITNVQDAREDMEETVINFVENMRTDDEAEIIKFNSIVSVVQDFTSEIDLLKDAIRSPYSGSGTNLYDAVVQAIDDTGTFGSKIRRAVIVVTDGIENSSLTDFDDVIAAANVNGVPVFTVGLGNLDATILQQMATDTGGQYYGATSSENLRTIYQQLSDVLFYDQYILTYDTGLGPGVTADLTIKARLNLIEGDDTKQITSCP